MTGIAKRILAGVGSVFVEIPTFETSPYQNGGGGFRQDYRNLKSDIATVCKDAKRSTEEFRHVKRGTRGHSKTGR